MTIVVKSLLVYLETGLTSMSTIPGFIQPIPYSSAYFLFGLAKKKRSCLPGNASKRNLVTQQVWWGCIEIAGSWRPLFRFHMGFPCLSPASPTLWKLLCDFFQVARRSVRTRFYLPSDRLLRRPGLHTVTLSWSIEMLAPALTVHDGSRQIFMSLFRFNIDQ